MLSRFLKTIGGGDRFLTVGVAVIVTMLLAISCAAPTPVPEGDIYLTWAAANLRAQSAQETAQAITLRVTQQARLTQQAREAYWFGVTQTAVAWNQEAQRAGATATAAAQATATAIGYAHETATAVARATATAEHYARETATASARATAVAPTVALAQERLETEIKREEWRQATIPIEHILQLLFWVGLIALAIATLVWAIPRAWHTLMLLILRARAGSPDKAVAYILTSAGFLNAWLHAPKLTTYDPDRDEGPGLVVDLETGEACRLPGGSPDTARQDQVVDALTRPAAASGRVPLGVTEQAARALQAPPYRILPPGNPPPQIASALPVLDARWREEERNE